MRAEQLAVVGTLSASIGHEIANPAMYAELHLQFAIDRALEEGATLLTLFLVPALCATWFKARRPTTAPAGTTPLPLLGAAERQRSV